MKHTSKRPRTRRSRERIGLCPIAARVAIAGEFLILAAVCDFAARVNMAYIAGAEGVFLRLSEFGSSLSATVLLLCGATLLTDYWERSLQERD